MQHGCSVCPLAGDETVLHFLQHRAAEILVSIVLFQSFLDASHNIIGRQSLSPTFAVIVLEIRWSHRQPHDAILVRLRHSKVSHV